MKKILALSMIGIFSFSGLAFADTYVQGHYRSDGTYVQGHYRSDANDTTEDNYSHKGNRNPYTGQYGTRR